MSVSEWYTHARPPPQASAVSSQQSAVSSQHSRPSVRPFLCWLSGAYIGRMELWLRDWRIAMDISKSTAVIFVKAARCIQKPRPVQFTGLPKRWVERARHLGVTLDTHLKLVSTYQPGGKEGSSKIGRAWLPPQQGKRSVRQKQGAALQATPLSCDGLSMSDLKVRCQQHSSEAASFTFQVSSNCEQRTLER
jgi:hypothetical protein